MSQVDAKSFLERVTRDPGLRQAAVTELEGKTESTPQRLIELGAQHGLTFTETELVDAWKEFQSTDQRALSDSELDGVTGGTKALPKLLEAAIKGKVFKKVEIHGTATYGDAGEQLYK
jgi:predicted ribosomally synthesized peptide with nif11-like leader